mmetsp:Transcript_55449/g.164854  ORF Transcript_55449/g.164854 Transcript_55449/m.164854 type:complete len:546 (+) Transcript_55449:100-1737(+)
MQDNLDDPTYMPVQQQSCPPSREDTTASSLATSREEDFIQRWMTNREAFAAGCSSAGPPCDGRSRSAQLSRLPPSSNLVSEAATEDGMSSDEYGVYYPGQRGLPDRRRISKEAEDRSTDEERNNAVMSGAKAISQLMKVELEGFCRPEPDSIYGAAVAMPQIARSAGWPKALVGLMVRVYILLALNYFLQGFLICVINEEALVFHPFGGQMHLCDFGGNLESCPGGKGCIGPGGTEISPSRLYDYTSWGTRTFFRNSLASVFPERAEEIHQKVDPGEYGLENWYCRLVCQFLFMMGVVADLCASVELGVMIMFVPSSEDLWLSYETPDWAEKDMAKIVKDWGELDLIRFQVAGMPLCWKVVNIIFVMVPKFLLWYSVTSAGFRFLMETNDIMDQIVNAMALTFILDIDELIVDRFATVATKHMMQNLEGFPLFDAEAEDSETPEEAYKRLSQRELAPWTFQDIGLYWVFIPQKLATTIVLMCIFLYKYYYTYCYREEDGTWVSKDLHTPDGVFWDPLSLFFIGMNSESESVWSLRSALNFAAGGP